MNIDLNLFQSGGLVKDILNDDYGHIVFRQCQNNIHQIISFKYIKLLAILYKFFIVYAH